MTIFNCTLQGSMVPCLSHTQVGKEAIPWSGPWAEVSSVHEQQVTHQAELHALHAGGKHTLTSRQQPDMMQAAS